MAVNGAAYVAFDVDRIKEYVFAGHRPVDATGASELVKSLEEGDLLTSWLQGFGAEVIYARGGSGLLRVEDGSRAGELAGHLESQFRFRTRTASCSAVWIDANRGRGGGAFSETFRRLGVLLQRRKAEKAGEEPAEAWSMGYVARCDACGGQPAAW